MKFETFLSIKICALISLIFLSSLLLAQNNNEQAGQDSLDVNKKVIYQDFLDKDIFGNPISEKEIDNYNDKDRDEQKEEAESYIFGIGLLIFVSPIYLPLRLLEDDYSETLYYQKYPFENANGFTEFEGRRWMGSLTISSQYVDKNIVGYKVNSSFKFLRLSLEPSYSYYCSKKGEENISKFNATIKFTFAQNQFINFRSGLGYSYFKTNSKFNGANWIYEICFFQKPFNLKLNYNLTGYDFQSEEEVRFNNDFNINFGYFFKRINIKIGYRWHKIGEEMLNGPEISSIIWF